MIQKNDFIDRLAKKGYTKSAASEITDDFIRTIEEALISGEAVSFYGFGKFDVREYGQREVVSPTTKERITVPAFKSPCFTAGRALRRAVKEGFIRE